MQPRRVFVKSGAVAMFGTGAVPLWLGRSAAAQTRRNKVLVAIFQRGAADALNVVVPHGESAYYSLRPGIGIPRDKVLDLDGFFGLNPALGPLMDSYKAGTLAIVHATGSPDSTRSHFDAQDYMESGTPGRKATKDGWMNRALMKEADPSPVRAVSLGANLPRVLRGSNAAVAMASINEFQVRDRNVAPQFESMYANAFDKSMATTGKETFEAVRLLDSLRKQRYAPENRATYPNGRFGQNLKQIAQLIKADAGLEVAFADIGGWDHHMNEIGPTHEQGPLANLLREFGGGLRAFEQDLGDRMQDVVVVTMSEFGRTAKENGNRGTDHGHGSAMFVLGGAVNGGKVLGQWPGMVPEQLYEGRDLAVTTDFRDVLGEVVVKHLGNADLGSVFPSYQAGRAKFRGVIKA